MRSDKLQDDPERKLLRERGGAWLRRLREDAGLSQRQFAQAVDVGYYTFISQIESGRGKIPTDRYADWARVLKVDPQAFVCTLFSYYEPSLYEILFGDEGERRKSHLRGIKESAVGELVKQPGASVSSSARTKPTGKSTPPTAA